MTSNAIEIQDFEYEKRVTKILLIYLISNIIEIYNFIYYD